MASIRLLRGRIKSAKNIAQITKAMEMVSASKMKKAQAQAMSGKLYAQKIFDMVMELGSKTDITNHPLLTRPAHMTGKRLVIIFSTNKGMCGALNTNLFRYFLQQYPTYKTHDYVVLGKKASEMIVRIGGTLTADFSDTPHFSDIVPALSEMATTQFLKGTYDGVDLLYSEFFNALKQSPRKKTILPLSITAVDTEKKGTEEEFLIEPSVTEVFDELLPHYLENQIRDAALQAEASEHSARMVAMRNATDNAVSLIGEFTLMYNKARQEKITGEILDIITARLAVEG